MKKSDINKVLKEQGHGFVKVQTGDWTKPEKCFIGFDGKKVKGILGGSVGPMTVSTTYQQTNQEVINNVKSALKAIGMQEKDNRLVSPDGKIVLSLGLVDYPQYAVTADYDEGYRNYYIIPTFH